MAEFSHVIKLSKEEVEQAILGLALAKKPHGFSVEAHTFHTKASVVVAVTGGAEISWKDE